MLHALLARGVGNRSRHPFTYKGFIKMEEIQVFKHRLLHVSRHELLKALVLRQMCVIEKCNPKPIEVIVEVYKLT